MKFVKIAWMFCKLVVLALQLKIAEFRVTRLENVVELYDASKQIPFFNDPVTVQYIDEVIANEKAKIENLSNYIEVLNDKGFVLSKRLMHTYWGIA